ncbi:MAG: amidohydrolase family protein [Proteobacteria bacterium]|nr:amidohydrolase family protein [Pseudomonadota bacterium]
MTIDCHYHLEPRIQPVENLIEKMDRAGIEKTALMPTMWDPPPETPEFLLKLLRFLLTHRTFRGLAKSLAANFTPEGDIKLPKETVKLYPDPDNPSVAEAMEKYPDRFLGWIFVNPRGKNDQMEEYEKWKDAPGFIGVKAHPFWHQYPPIELLPLAEKLAETQTPLLIHVGFDSHGDFKTLTDKLPKLKLILAHTGFPGYSDTWKIIRENENILVDLSADAYVNGKTTRQAVEYLGVDRCLFGTDGPYGHHADDGLFDNGFLKRRIETLFRTEKDQKKLLGENFKELIGARL